jgi:translation initiation factor SUI1
MLRFIKKVRSAPPRLPTPHSSRHPQEFACNGTLIEDAEMGQIIQLQGDQRQKISALLVEEGIPQATIKVHGF